MKKETTEKMLRGDASPAEVKETISWLTTPEGEAFMMDDIESQFDNIDIEHIDASMINQTYNSLINHINRSNGRKRRYQWAASLIPFFLVSTLAAILLWDGVANTNYSEIIVAKGEKAEVVLHDGTIIHLNSDSKIKYPTKFGIFQRKVFLEGQAYFEVESSKVKPFIVELGNTSVKVTGTKFDVEAYDNMNNIVISLDEGRVAFEEGGKLHSIYPKQQLVYNTSTENISIESCENLHFAEWMNNTITVQRITLDLLLSKISRQYDVEFNIVDPAVCSFSYSLHANNLTLNEFLGMISAMSPVVFTHHDAAINVSEKR